MLSTLRASIRFSRYVSVPRSSNHCSPPSTQRTPQSSISPEQVPEGRQCTTPLCFRPSSSILKYDVKFSFEMTSYQWLEYNRWSGKEGGHKWNACCKTTLRNHPPRNEASATMVTGMPCVASRLALSYPIALFCNMSFAILTCLCHA